MVVIIQLRVMVEMVVMLMLIMLMWEMVMMLMMAIPAGNFPSSSPCFSARLFSLTVSCVLKYPYLGQRGFLKTAFISISEISKFNFSQDVTSAFSDAYFVYRCCLCIEDPRPP